MKNKTRRFSKSAFSVILALCMLLSCLTVGMISAGASINWYDYSGNNNHYLYYDDSVANLSAGGTKNIYVLMDYGSGSNVYKMDRVSSNTLLYKYTYSNTWNGCTAMAIKAASSQPATSTRYTACDRYTTSGNFNGNAVVFMTAGKTGTTLTATAWNANGGDLKANIKNNVTLATKVDESGSGTYSDTTTNIATLSLKSHYWNNGSVSDAGAATGFDNGKVTYNNAVGAAKIEFSYSDLSNSYTFKGWYDSSGNKLSNESTYTGYQAGQMSNISYYAYFQKKEDVYSVAGETGLTGYSWSTTTNDMTKSGSSYTKTFSDIAAGTYKFKIAKNHSWDGAIGYSSNVTGTGLVTSVSGESNDGSNIVFTTSGSANITITFTPTNTIVIDAVSNLQQLSAPTNVKLNGSAANCTVTATTVGAKISLSWNSVTNAGSYKIYKGDDLVTTVTTTSYSIERAYSSTGKYTVVAVPSNANAYSESPKSTGYTLTVNKKTLSAPTVTVSPTAIALGSTVDLTATDQNSGVTAAQYNLYYYETSLSATNDYLMTSGTAKTITPATAGTHTYKVVAYPVDGSSNDYYTQSSATSANTVTVYAPSWYLIGDLVDSGDNKWSNNNNNFPVDTYDSPNIFKRTITYASGGTTDKHYFRIHKGNNGDSYTNNGSQSTDMSSHNSSASAVTANVSSASHAMYVTGQGTYTIYVNQSNASAPKVWVVATAPQTYTTTVYVNKDSGATNLYVWKEGTGEIAEWPGEDITTTEESVNDIPYYKYTFTGYLDHFSMVVNKGDDTKKSADITNKAGDKTYYVTWNGTHLSSPDCSETAPVIQLGYKVQNSNSPSHVDFSNRSVSVTLAANTTYEFWLKSANSHLNDQGNGTMTRANCTNWSFPVNNTNTKIQADLAGTYTFTYTVSNGNISVSVTYPPEPKYNVTVNQGDHGTVKVNGSNFTTGGTIQVGSLTTASIEAVAASGYHFTGWTTSGGVAAVSGYTTSSNPITISASAQGTITATYAEDSYTLTLQSQNTSYGTITAPSSKTLTVHPITATSLSGVTVSPANGYKFNGWTAGTGVTLTGGSTSNASTGSVKATQNSTLTANFTKVSYTLTGQTSLNGTVGNYGTVTFYSNAACTTQITTAQIGNTVYAKFTSNDYALVSFTKSGTGSSGGTTTGNVYSFTMGYANTTVTAAVRAQPSVTYYVDMHGNSISTMSIAVVQNMGGTVVKDGNGKDCSATLGDSQGVYRLTKQGSSSVYAATISTPTPTGDLYVKISFNGNSIVKSLDSSMVSTLLSTTHEMWLEAENEASTALKVNYATNATPTVADGNRRIYLAKPYSWQSDEPAWENIGIYHWGNYTDIGWNAGTKMHYLGNSGSDGYHYYYVDIPKAIDGNKVSNLIFQGWGSNSTAGTYSKAQTGNIENIPDSANFFYLSKVDGAFVGTKSEEDAVIPNYTRYVSSVEMNKTETTAVSVKPTYTGENITYTSGNTSVVTVDDNGNITPVGRGTTTITVKIFGTISNLVTTEDNDHKDYRTYTVSVTVKDPTRFNGFEIMSLESKTYTVNIPAVSGNQPGYFDMSNVVMTVEGIHGVASSTSSAIITQTSTTSVSGVGTVCTAFTVQYAKANSLFENYGDINIIGKVTTKSIARSGGQRYGHESWEVDGETEYFTTSRTIANSVETATTNGIPFDDSKTTYSAIFAAYNYVDVTFTFNYEEYNPKVVDGKIQYPYDSTWAAESGSHTTKTVTVSNYEVRELTAANISSQANDYLNKLVAAAGGAIVVLPQNNYYNYNINGSSINVTATNAGAYTAAVTVNLNRSVRTYSVYRNGNLFGSGYTYQQYADIAPSGQSANTFWYAVDTQNSTDTTNAPLLATGSSYKFRVKGDTYLRTKNGTITDADFNRSEVDFSHYEVTHQGSTSTNMKEYLLQNFYIADFFSPSKVLDPNSNNGQGNLPYDDAQFVGGGVVYYSVTNGAPFANAISSGYVGNDGKVNANAIKEMLKANIEAQYNKDNVAGTVGEDDAMKAAYGTEIEAKKNVEGGFNTGIIYRYLPLNEYKRDGSGNLETDGEGKYTLAYDVNNNTFRYSNTLQSYQYVYASGNENKATNAGKNMRLYSYYVYSYVAYNQETNVPETRYEIVLSDNYSDASTYWEGPNN